MRSARSFALAASLLYACTLAAPAPCAVAQTINFSLNVFYTTPSDSNSGGTWEVVAKSSGEGIAGVDLHLQNILNAALRAPRGTVNGNDGAGFNLFVNATFPNFTIAQVPLALSAGETQGAFYGVGELTNGSPTYPMQQVGTNSEGPAIPSLTAPLDLPWAVTDAFGDMSWATAARLLSGTFATNVTPAFGGGNNGNVFTSLGSQFAFGDISAASTITTIVRTNFVANSADYNHNGLVDAADYVLWRKQNGTSVPMGTGADGTGDGMVNDADYTLWRQHFGLTSGAGAGANLSTGSVPEPQSAVFVVLAGVLFLLTIRNSRGCRAHAFAASSLALPATRIAPSGKLHIASSTVPANR